MLVCTRMYVAAPVGPPIHDAFKSTSRSMRLARALLLFAPPSWSARSTERGGGGGVIIMGEGGNWGGGNWGGGNREGGGVIRKGVIGEN